MRSRSMLSVEELSVEEIGGLLDLADELAVSGAVAPQSGFVAFLSERESMRTRLSTHRAASLLGLAHEDLELSSAFYADPLRRLDHANIAGAELASLRELGCVALVARIRDDAVLKLWRETRTVPVLNGCSDSAHPLQALSDALVMRQVLGCLAEVRLTLVGNGNLPVFRSLLFLAARTGIRLTLACPAGYGFPEEALTRAGLARQAVETQDLVAAVSSADVVYADSIAYRQPTPAEARVFGPYRVTRRLFEEHAPHARFMHCLPHADEIDPELVLDPRALAMQQVAARIPVAAAAILTAIGAEDHGL